MRRAGVKGLLALPQDTVEAARRWKAGRIGFSQSFGQSRARHARERMRAPLKLALTRGSIVER